MSLEDALFSKSVFQKVKKLLATIAIGYVKILRNEQNTHVRHDTSFVAETLFMSSFVTNLNIFL